MTLYPTGSPCPVDADEIRDDLLECLTDYQHHGLLPNNLTSNALGPISDEIAARMDASADAIAQLVSQDDDPFAGVLSRQFPFPAGGPRCIVDVDVSNIGDFINGLVRFDFAKEA